MYYPICAFFIVSEVARFQGFIFEKIQEKIVQKRFFLPFYNLQFNLQFQKNYKN